jgi:SAM-dependent methyltransferase
VKNATLLDYYARRVEEYERIYQKPERQADLGRLKAYLADLLAGREVLEIACGTGYWTAHLAPVARSILATDAVADVLDAARSKPYPKGRVRFARADAYALDEITGVFSAGFAGFWWSHVPKMRLVPFLQTFHQRLQPGAVVVFVDNRYVAGSSTPLSATDADGNTYQERRLADGSRHRVLKNFPTDADLRAAVADAAVDVVVENFTYYWCLSYTLI